MGADIFATDTAAMSCKDFSHAETCRHSAYMNWDLASQVAPGMPYQIAMDAIAEIAPGYLMQGGDRGPQGARDEGCQ